MTPPPWLRKPRLMRWTTRIQGCWAATTSASWGAQGLGQDGVNGLLEVRALVPHGCDDYVRGHRTNGVVECWSYRAMAGTLPPPALPRRGPDQGRWVWRRTGCRGRSLP